MRTDGISPSRCNSADEQPTAAGLSVTDATGVILGNADLTSERASPTPDPEWVAQVYPLPARPLSFDAAAQHRERIRLSEVEAIREVQRGTLNQRSIAPPSNSTPRRARGMLLRHALAAMVAAATIAALIETFRGAA